jgi:wobble nucleotide-excising tRNase
MIDPALKRVERGDATVADAEELRQALAIKSVQVEALRMELVEAQRDVREWRELMYTLRERSKDYVANRTKASLYAMIEVQREADRRLLVATGEEAECAVKSA